MQNLSKLFQSFLLTLWIFVGLNLLHAEEGKESRKNFISTKNEEQVARELLNLPPSKMLEAIEGLPSSDAGVISSHIRNILRSSNPDLDRSYFLLRHLERLQATDLAQKRLNSLLSVIFLSLSVFMSFMVYVFFDQRKSIAIMKELIQKKNSSRFSRKRRERPSSSRSPVGNSRGKKRKSLGYRPKRKDNRIYRGESSSS